MKTTHRIFCWSVAVCLLCVLCVYAREFPMYEKLQISKTGELPAGQAPFVIRRQSRKKTEEKENTLKTKASHLT